VCVCLVRCGFVYMCVCERDTERKTEPRREEEGGLFLLMLSLPMLPLPPLSDVADAAVCVCVCAMKLRGSISHPEPGTFSGSSSILLSLTASRIS